MKEKLKLLTDNTYLRGFFDNAGGYMFLNIPFEEVPWYSNNIASMEQKENFLTLFHEIIHLLQSCATIYGISQYIEFINMRNLILFQLLKSLHKRSAFPSPLIQLSDKGDLKGELDSVLKNYKIMSMFNWVSEGGIKFIPPVEENKIDYITTNIIPIYKYNLAFISEMKQKQPLGYSFTKLATPYWLSSESKKRDLLVLLGAITLKESWSALTTDMQDRLLVSNLNTKIESYKFDYEDYFERCKKNLARNPYLKIYTCHVDFLTEYLELNDYEDFSYFLVHLMDFVLMYFNKARVINPEITPEMFFLDILDIVKENELLKKFELRNDRTDISELYRIRKLISDTLGFDDEETTIKEFIKEQIDPYIESFNKFPSGVIDAAYLRICKEGLIRRQWGKGLFTVPFNSELYQPVQSFLYYALDKGFFILDKNLKIIGDFSYLPRIIFDNLIEQFMFEEIVICPLIKLGIPCNEKISSCDCSFYELLKELIFRKHECLFTNIMKLFGSDILNNNP